MKFSPANFRTAESAFTMVEIAICLAIISFALLAIVGALPLGMNTQQYDREKTIVNQDATVFIEAVSKGARGADDLTNYVYAIVNTGTSPAGYINPLLAGEMNFNKADFPTMPWYPILTNGANIVGLLSTPEFTTGLPDLAPTYNLFNGGYSNRVVACVRSISGAAVEKPSQDNSILIGDSFSYRVFCVNAPVASASPNSAYADDLQANLHELRMTFLWPVLPNGNLSSSPVHETYRATVAGQILQAVSAGQAGHPLYFYQPQSFTNAP
jgi:type II secretory pathway pseudopilin PulG